MRTAAALLILSAAACDDGGDVVPATAPTAGPRVPLLRQDGHADAMLSEGYLHVEGPCLYVTGRGGAGPRTMPAFTVAVHWDERENVLVAGPHRIRPGDHVALGGSPATDKRLLTWVQPPDPSCDTRNINVSNSIEPAANHPGLNPRGRPERR